MDIQIWLELSSEFGVIENDDGSRLLMGLIWKPTYHLWIFESGHCVIEERSQKCTVGVVNVLS